MVLNVLLFSSELEVMAHLDEIPEIPKAVSELSLDSKCLDSFS